MSREDVTSQPTLRLHMWIEAEEGVVFGLGRMLLLAEVQRSGSLRAAAETMRMSYRAAWGKLKATEKVLGKPLVEKDPANHSRFHLTAYGETLLARFRELYSSVEAYALDQAEELFSFPLCRHPDGKRNGLS